MAIRNTGTLLCPISTPAHWRTQYPTWWIQLLWYCSLQEMNCGLPSQKAAHTAGLSTSPPTSRQYAFKSQKTLKLPELGYCNYETRSGTKYDHWGRMQYSAPHRFRSQNISDLQGEHTEQNIYSAKTLFTTRQSLESRRAYTNLQPAVLPMWHLAWASAT